MSVLEGSANAILRRVMVNEDDHADGLGILCGHARDTVSSVIPKKPLSCVDMLKVDIFMLLGR